MAGNYPDVPSWRMAYDRDGTTVVRLDSTASSQLNELTTTQKQSLNSEVNGTLHADNGTWLAFIFPEARDVDAILVISGGTQMENVQVSTNTTNGMDGTWVAYPGVSVGTPGTIQMRTAIDSGTALAQRGVRFKTFDVVGSGEAIQNVHLFGEIAPGENPNRLSLVKVGADERIDPAYLDWGNVPRSSTADKTFRVKNLSSTLTARSVRVALEALTNTTPSVPAQHTLSYNGGPFLAQVNLGDLAPGAISATITLRRITPSNAVLGLWWLRTFAEADSWD